MTYSISEIFHSIQGEGVYTGVPHLFIRLAGCNVGKYPATMEDLPKNYQATEVEGCFKLDPEDKSYLRILQPKHSFCTTFDGQRFLCDTDYHTFFKMTPEDIAGELNKELHCCITGGEPLLHNLNPLIEALFKQSDSLEMIHFETSGTLPLPELAIPAEAIWITCCPKQVNGKHFGDGSGIDPKDVDEWKILVGPEFKEQTLKYFETLIPSTCENRFLQPINGVHEVWNANVEKCLELLDNWPHWRLSSQLHKYIQIR